MSNFIFTISKGRDIAYAQNVIDGSPANSRIVLVLLKAVEAADACRDRLTVASVLTASTECDFGNYARIELDNTSGITVTLNSTTNLATVDIPDQVLIDAGIPNNTMTSCLVCYDNDILTGDDSTLIPIYHYDFIDTTNGENLTIEVAANGLSSQ